MRNHCANIHPLYSATCFSMELLTLRSYYVISYGLVEISELLIRTRITVMIYFGKSNYKISLKQTERDIIHQNRKHTYWKP